MKVTEEIPPDAVKYVLRNLRHHKPEITESEAKGVIAGIWMGDTKTLTDIYRVPETCAEIMVPIIKTWNGNGKYRV